ncbi:MAG: AGE family epimerase/isomerase [Tannerella sp.]|jgi:predicted alpha-1,6-mannanase (GH76 family)|nr:AGE family epimerase/isomerase [Tannerella sp.]
MKCIKLFILSALIPVLLGNISIDRHASVSINWTAVADSSSKSLINNFLNTSTGYFNQASDSSTWGGHYWPQAHALDVLVDAYVRSGDDFYKSHFEAWLTGVRTANGNKWANNYIDDMEWIGLASLRAYQATGITAFLTTCREVWDGTTVDMEDNNAAFGIKRAWTDAGEGGIFWESRRNRHSKNACSNGPAAILAARLYQAFGEKEDLEWAKRIYAWEKQYLFSPDSGAVYDNLNTRTGVINRRIYTYNQGTFLGAAVELYKITGEKSYLDDAIQAANYTLKSMIDTGHNLLKREGSGDGGLFKGIFIRYFAQLILSDGLSNDIRNRYVDFLKYNGETLWTEGTSKPKTLFSPYWKTPPGERTGLTEHLSGCMLMEALAMLQKQGKL